MYRSRVRVAACSMAVVLLALAAGQAQAGEIISAVGVNTVSGAGEFDRVSTTAGGAVNYSDATYTMKAMTDYGVNRIYNQSAVTGDYSDGYASSVWGETFTAQGTGTVNLKFTFTIDGSVAYGPATTSHSFNYLVSALKGAWNLSSQYGYDDIVASIPTQSSEPVGGQLRNFSGARTVDLSGPTNTVIYQATSSDGVSLQRYVTKEGASFTIDTITQNPFTQVHAVYSPTGFSQNGNAEVPYGNLPAGALASYQNSLNNFPLLAQASLCSGYSVAGGYDGCAPGDYPPTTLTLEFNLAAGTTFTLVSSLMSENAENGTVDFYNTVRLKDIVATGGTLTSDNALLQTRADGTLGFTSADAIAAVPEPASWAMLIAGFGMVGTAVRRTRRRAASFA